MDIDSDENKTIINCRNLFLPDCKLSKIKQMTRRQFAIGIYKHTISIILKSNQFIPFLKKNVHNEDLLCYSRTKLFKFHINVRSFAPPPQCFISLLSARLSVDDHIQFSAQSGLVTY
jgi:hypothetical protein